MATGLSSVTGLLSSVMAAGLSSVTGWLSCIVTASQSIGAGGQLSSAIVNTEKALFALK